MSPTATGNRPPAVPTGEAQRRRGAAEPIRAPAETLDAQRQAVRDQVERALARATGPIHQLHLEK